MQLKRLHGFFLQVFDKTRDKEGKSGSCPVCRSKAVCFLPLPAFYSENAKKYGYEYFGTCEMTATETYYCSKCGATDRERLYAYYLNEFHAHKKNISFYHFAPEKCLSDMIRSRYKEIKYVTFDLLSENVDVNADLTDLCMLADGECDFFICSHVLEHVDDDRKAIGELFRITKKGGMGILMAPVSLAIKKTIENIPDVKTDADRWKYYGQEDHVRLYAKKDYVDRITASGFELEEIGIGKIGKKAFLQMGLKPTSVLYVVRKD